MASVEFNIHNDGAPVGLLTVNRPDVRNALNWDAMAAFAAAVDAAAAREDLRALIVTGAGKAFISGGDVAELRAYPDQADAARMIALMGDTLNRLAALPCPVIAAMEGPARGGGAEVALACDWRVAAEDADIGFVQVRLGLTTGWGGAARLAALVGEARALDLLALGRVLTAGEAHHLGIVTHLTLPDEALPNAFNLASALAEFDPGVVRAYKRIVRASGRSLAEGQVEERAGFPGLWAAEAHLGAVERFLRKGK